MMTIKAKQLNISLLIIKKNYKLHNKAYQH